MRECAGARVLVRECAGLPAGALAQAGAKVPVMLCAVVPAAGRSSRFGSDKRLALIDGVPMLERTVSALSEAGAEPVIVVRENPDLDRGMFSTIQIGLAEAVASGADVVLVHPADMPYVRAETIRTVAARSAQTGEVVCPRFNGKRGHPIAIPVDIARSLLNLEPRTPLNEAFAQLGLVRDEMDVDDPDILRDVDVPADLAP